MGLTFKRAKQDIYKSVLSNTSLGIPAAYVPVKDRNLGSYTRNGIQITRLVYPRPAAFPRFRLVVAPVLGWFASSMAYFIFHKNVRRDIEVMISHVPRKFNPSGWIKNYQECYAIGVPKDLRKEMREWLYLQKYYLDTKCNRWKKFFNHESQRTVKRRKANAA